MRIFAIAGRHHLHPRDSSPQRGLLGIGEGNVIFGLARNGAGHASGALIQVDNHCPFMHRRISSALPTYVPQNNK
jgi:hypothetical protein